MTKYIEIGALVEKSSCDNAYGEIYKLEGVEYVFVETGRSNDLFSERQFGEFGEAAILTVIADSKKKDAVLGKLYEVLKMGENPVGLLYEEKALEKTKFLY
jgi:hypothetical protein